MVTNPYEVLGVSSDATDEQVKAAYRELAKKYHPDKFADSPLKDVADEKMKEINEAYDMIVDMRKNGNTGSGYNGYSGYSGQSYQNYASQNPVFQRVRSLIMSNNLDEAEKVLNSLDETQKNAEWYFLKGMVASRRGWNEQAFQFIQRAVQMDPSNPEYNAAYNNIMRSRQYGAGGPYNQPNGAYGCSCCDMCAGIMCADMCCRCCGGGC
ncbi:MAG: DnaJ domain-containing protein [Oscillospiraceae bacterium]|nr:DnaJ domain-containing protein [Oscillospiraceae bacterium]